MSMNIAYFGNTLNRHQVYVADVLYDLTNGEYTYVETVPPTIENSSMGKAKIERPYVLPAYKDSKSYALALKLARECDVAIFGADSLSFEVERMLLDNRLSFEVSERLLKRSWYNIISPSLLKRMWYFHSRGWSKKFLYKLCASAYGANDQYALHSFIGKCYKWGYFTNVEDFDINVLLSERYNNGKFSESKMGIVSIMWCGRYLSWKHPELPVYLAQKLKEKGFSFILDMYGSGRLLERTKQLATKLKVEELINFYGSVPNDVVLNAMRSHSIFLFTSDRREGWGAVLNEAMANGCAVVASDKIGAAPFLIKDMVNGCFFKSGSIDSLLNRVLFLLNNPNKCRDISFEAYHTMHELWSPKIAAHNLFKLSCYLLNHDEEEHILMGPCSKALPIFI